MKLALIACALGAAVSSGVLLAFSSFVMAALARLEPPAGITAMQAINITVINPLFMGIYFGTGMLSLIVAFLAWRSGIAGTALIITGTLIYLFGVLGITIALNVPMNDQLAGLRPTSQEAASYWQVYLSRWTFWNHVRCIAALIASVVFCLAVAQQ